MEYDRALDVKENMMKGLKGGTITMDRQLKRQIGEGHGGYIPRSNSNMSLSVINDDNAIDYKTKKINKLKGMTEIRKFRPRDLAMYTQTDSLQNVILDNTKEKRMKDL